MTRDEELLELINEQAKDMKHGSFQPPQDGVVLSLDLSLTRDFDKLTFADLLVEDEYGVHLSK